MKKIISKKLFKIKNTETIDKLNKIIVFFIRLSLILAIFGAIYNFRWIILAVSLITFFLTFLPHLFEDKYKIMIPVELEIITLLFIYASLFLGEIQGYYAKFWWWDILLHSGAAMAFGFIGFTILFILYKGDKIKANPLTITIFSFFFALGIGALWEIFEFAMDQIFALNMQKSGLIDTMWDLIVDAIGALIVSIGGYYYLKKDKSFIFKNVLNRFIEENPKIFKRFKR